MERLEPALLGGRQVGGQGEGAQRGERVVEAGQALLELVGVRRHGRPGRRRAGDAQRVAAERGAVTLVGDAVRLHQREGLARAQVVARHRRQHGVLVGGAERAQRVGHGGAEATTAELLRGRRREARGEEEPLLHPGGLAPEQARGGPRGKPVLGHQ